MNKQTESLIQVLISMFFLITALICFSNLKPEPVSINSAVLFSFIVIGAITSGYSVANFIIDFINYLKS